MAKEIISQQVADAIESLEGWELHDVVEVHTHIGFRVEGREVINTLPTHLLVKLITEGYEIEKPDVTYPSELVQKADGLVRDYRDRIGSDMFSYSDGVKDGIKHAISELGIKVKGINI